MTAPPRVLTLPGGEPVLHYGANTGPQLLFLQPLFEEANRCRGFVARLCRGLVERGIGCWLPDLPGEGESARALGDVGWSDWLDCVLESDRLIARETAQAPTGTIALRGGALLDIAGTRRWRLSPVAGASLLTDLRRAGLIANGAYATGDALAGPLGDAVPDEAEGTRTVRLTGDRRPCDRQIDGAALWRRSEPGDDPVLAALLIDDIADWLAT